jgi:hypothetical protein
VEGRSGEVGGLRIIELLNEVGRMTKINPKNNTQLSLFPPIFSFPSIPIIFKRRFANNPELLPPFILVFKISIL